MISVGEFDEIVFEVVFEFVSEHAELASLKKLMPSQVWVLFIECGAVELFSELPEQYEIVLEQVVAEHEFLCLL